MYVIVGLGNPGRKFENTRHNMGFHAIDLISEKTGIKVDRLKFKALVGEGMIGTEKVLLVKPQTYMNLSGESVRDIFNFYKIPIENLLVIYDDIDLDTGSFRIRPKGSSGTHNGMRNIIYLLGQDGFPRIRVGINSDRGRMALRDFVTSGISCDDCRLLEQALTTVCDAAICVVTDGVTEAMNKYNVSPKRKKKEEKKAAEALSTETSEAAELASAEKEQAENAEKPNSAKNAD